MDIETAVKGAIDSLLKLRTTKGISDPSFMSEQMQRLAQYIGAIEEQLATLEQDFERDSALKLKKYLIDDKMKVTQAEKMVKVETADLKARIAYLSRFVASGWKQVGVLQSRINHLTAEWNIK